MKKYFLFASMLSVSLAFGQSGENMVENGSFESITGKGPKKLGGIESATGWISATGAKADLFLKDKKLPEIDPEKNIYGGEQAQDGQNFAGVWVYSQGNKIPRTYITAKLNAPMKKGQAYCVKFYVSLGDNSKFATNNIAANFSKKDISIADKKSIIDQPHVRDVKNRVFSGTYSWERVCGTYIAEGGERFITIGNFNMTEETKVDKVKKDPSNKSPQVGGAYYFIDNISVQLLDDEERCDCGSDDYVEVGSSMIYSKSDYIRDNMTLEEKLAASTVYFGFGRDLITGSAQRDLDRIAQWMKENPNVRIRVIAHIDEEEAKLAVDNPVYKAVAMRRANGVIKYLMDQGIDESRLVATDKGDRAPAESEGDDIELNQAKNRRVEFQIITR
jgi:outer membrane protein OmpA-like peptidoglycan-associated protein